MSRPLVSPYDYSYIGGQLWYCKVGSQELFITWDETGHPWTLQTGGQTYWYVTNLQGDVVALLDAAGNEVVTYSYDAWGNIRTIGGSKATTLGQDNPLRYRGYVYDQETGLYYLQSRYYDPEIGRFLNADTYASTGQGVLGSNVYAYCLNNPTNLSDPLGESAIAEGIKGFFIILPLLDGPIPAGEIIAVIGFAAIYLYEQTQARKENSSISSHTINWNPNNNLKNHILKGTKSKHVDGWKRFGVDPGDNNAWNLLLPLLKEVVDKADDVQSTPLSNGSRYIEYIKTYAEQGVRVIVKIWVDATGTIQEISDAIPRIIYQ